MTASRSAPGDDDTARPPGVLENVWDCPRPLGAADRLAYVVPGPQPPELCAADAQLADDHGGAGMGGVRIADVRLWNQQRYVVVVEFGRTARRSHMVNGGVVHGGVAAYPQAMLPV
ncbi:hypothetical protein GCM10009662_03620 [Catellatospora coxensis]|uniref:Uncharacterized protein n=1 Tax=Catellatospora coxensis TaxID=310354 RepID=A0A8J3PAH7_9ACTN|nr:hypothetical protein Cco03nite_61080 [Catellatospora coxensis]